MWRNWNSYTCWWKCKWEQLLWKTVLQFFKRLKMGLPDNPEIPQGIKNICPHKHVYMNFHSSIVHSSRKVETTQLS